jgi:hypothetical protein
MKTRKFLSGILATALVLGVSALPAQAAKAPKTYNFKVTGTISGANGKTVLLLADTGRVLGSQSITAAKQGLSITSSQKTSNLSGATLQLVTTSGGDYFGPVVLGWKSKTQVYTQFGTKTSGKGKYKVGTIVVSSASASGLQGYGKVKKKLSLVKKNVVAATNYKPAGVGTYGKTGGAAVALLGGARGFVGVGPIGDIDLRNVIAEDKKFDGGDADGDGLPNAFDVNDDGDAVLDQADANSPTPNAGANCQAGASFNIFTNFKNTATNLAENINAYGTGDSTATDAKIATALTNTMSIVLQPITSVCGSNVTKSEFKGVGTLPYAPADYVDITGKSGGTGDYQWTVGNGQISGSVVTGLAPFTFTAPNQISGQDVLMQRVTTADGNVYEFAGTMGFVFVSHPLPLRYSTDNGTSWSNFTFSGGTASYGTLASTTKLTVEFAVPQRLAFDGEAAGYWDLGNMTYSPDAPNMFGGGNGPGKCDSQAATDSTADSAVATTARTFQLAFILGTCFSEKSKSWGSTGQELQGGVDIQVVPAGGGGNSAQKLGISAQ